MDKKDIRIRNRNGSSFSRFCKEEWDMGAKHNSYSCMQVKGFLG